jgi:hypothetical protein
MHNSLQPNKHRDAHWAEKTDSQDTNCRNVGMRRKICEGYREFIKPWKGGRRLKVAHI